MCAEGLSAIINRHENVGLINGCAIARGAPSISHLLFANDCYLFFRTTEVEACTMKGILKDMKICLDNLLTIINPASISV